MTQLRELAEQRGYFLRREALRLGLSDRVLHRGVASGHLVRLRQGAYCHADIWRRLREDARFLARSLAAYELTEGDVALSHTSALAHYECPLVRTPLKTVHLTYRQAGTTRVEAGTTRHLNTETSGAHFIERGGVLVTTPPWAVIGAMTVMPLESAVVAGDWMINHKLTTQEELWDLKTRLNHHPKTRQLEVAVRLLDGSSQSPGESRCRFLFWLMELPCPRLQWEVRDAAGDLIAITDFAWPDLNIYGEFDGRIKYGRLLKPGQSAGDAVFAEKQREDAIRRVTGGTVVRWIWSDIHMTSAPSLQLKSLLRAAA